MNEFLDAKALLRPYYEAESGLRYPEKLPAEGMEHVPIDLTNTPLEVYYEDMAALTNEEFALIRRSGFGGSDSGVLLGVNPYDSITELIAQKASTALSEEEKATGQQVAVIKGNDLEPLIVDKFENIFQMKTVKPTAMYVFKDWEYLKMNFDGVTGTPEQYLPVEIKVVTKKGERHYDASKAIYIEREGYKRLPDNHAATNNSVMTKAALYGIPPYYYTQLQQEMMALNAPFGYLCSLWESTWTIHVFFVHADQAVWNAIKIEGYKAWEQVLKLKERNNGTKRVPPSSTEDQQPGTIEY